MSEKNPEKRLIVSSKMKESVTVLVIFIATVILIVTILSKCKIQSEQAKKEQLVEHSKIALEIEIKNIQNTIREKENKTAGIADLVNLINKEKYEIWVQYAQTAATEAILGTAESAKVTDKESAVVMEVDTMLNITSAYLLSDVQTLPENTETTVAGTKVQVPEEWCSHSVSYVSTTDGTIVESTVKTSNVSAVATGNGEIVPVPNGFYYVGGNLDTGVIISDDSADEYDGITDKTTYDYTKSLQGNQFVWIPCTEEEYVKTNWGTLYQNANWETIVNTAEMSQIKKYGGFYVARYEAGLASTITEYTNTQTQTILNPIYNLVGIPQSKADLMPWNFIDWNYAQANSRLMYNTDAVHSGLITGTQWDVILNKMLEKTDLETADLTNSINWGNYINNSIEYNGKAARAYTSSKKVYLQTFGEPQTGNTTVYSSGSGDLLSTGAASVTEKYHIFDIAGNLWEWTEEVSMYKVEQQYRMARGGSFMSQYPVFYRAGTVYTTYMDYGIGFRIVLYIQ